MSSAVAKLSNILGRIERAERSDALWANLKDYAAELNFAHMVGICSPQQDLSLAGSFALGDLEILVMPKSGGDADYMQHPFFQRARLSDEPFIISEMREDTSYAGTHWQTMAPAVLKSGDGLVVPIYLGGRMAAVVKFAGKSPDLTPVARASLHIATHAATEKYYVLRQTKRRVASLALSEREQDCLKLVAAGMSDQAIAMELGIMPRTVRFHIDGAKVKLGVGTRVQAVTKALRDRIIAI